MLQHAEKNGLLLSFSGKRATSAVLASWLATRHYRRVADPGSAATFGIPQTKLSRDSNQIARGRIRQFESDMPSQAVRSLGDRGESETDHSQAATIDMPRSNASLRNSKSESSHSYPRPVAGVSQRG
jgi:hypothetical protein